YNIIGSTTGNSITGTTTGNQLNVANPGLDPNGLANNGGPTQTIALVTGSVAIDKGKALGGANTDQRGSQRPFDNTGIANATGGDGSDIGAFEVVPEPEIGVQQPVGTDLTDGVSTVAFGNVSLGNKL